MATIKTGLLDTEDILSTERDIDMEGRIKQLQPDEQQFRVWLSQIAKKQAFREIVEWLNRRFATFRPCWA